MGKYQPTGLPSLREHLTRLIVSQGIRISRLNLRVQRLEVTVRRMEKKINELSK